jgi:hypothetical protein
VIVAVAAPLAGIEVGDSEAVNVVPVALSSLKAMVWPWV